MTLIEQQKRIYQSKSIIELRELGRSVGVKSPTSLSKEQLVNHIVAICFGGELPANKETRGRPAKKKFLDDPYTYIANEFKSELDDVVHTFAASNNKSSSRHVTKYEGYASEDYTKTGKLYTSNFCRENFCEKVDPELVEIRPADLLTFSEEEGVRTLVMVNRLSIQTIKKRGSFDMLTPSNLRARVFKLAEPSAQKALDGFAPAMFGGRTIICSGANSELADYLEMFAGAEKDGLAAEIIPLFSSAIKERYKSFEDKTGREIIRFEKSDPKETIRVAKFCLERAKRVIEMGLDAILLIDNLVELAKICQQAGDKDLDFIRELFMSGMCDVNGGTITVIVGIDRTSAFGEKIFTELEPYATNRITFDRAYLTYGVPVPIDLNETFNIDKGAYTEAEMALKKECLKVYYGGKTPDRIDELMTIVSTMSEADALEKIKHTKFE